MPDRYEQPVLAANKMLYRPYLRRAKNGWGTVWWLTDDDVQRSGRPISALYIATDGQAEADNDAAEIDRLRARVEGLESLLREVGGHVTRTRSGSWAWSTPNIDGDLAYLTTAEAELLQEVLG